MPSPTCRAMATSSFFDFHGRTALITGGAGGIGAAVARRLLAGGARVATLDLVAPADDAVVGLTGDATRSADVDEAVTRVEAELGPVDIAVCAAGIRRWSRSWRRRSAASRPGPCSTCPGGGRRTDRRKPPPCAGRDRRHSVVAEAKAGPTSAPRRTRSSAGTTAGDQRQLREVALGSLL